MPSFLKKVFIKLSNESLVEQLSEQKIEFFGANVIKRVFKDHLNNNHTIIQFGNLTDESHIKFHNIALDIELFMNENRLYSITNAIEFLKQNGGLLIFLDKTHQTDESIKDFGIGAQIISSLNIKEISLLTSGGKHSFIGLNGFGLKIKDEIQV